MPTHGDGRGFDTRRLHARRAPAGAAGELHVSTAAPERPGKSTERRTALPTIGETFNAKPETLVARYDRQRKQIPAAFRGVPHIVLRVAYREAGKDWRRITLAADGGLLVHRDPQWDYQPLTGGRRR